MTDVAPVIFLEPAREARAAREAQDRIGYPVRRPSIALPDPSQLTILAVDTETSGLHVDDGARICAVSLAWRTEAVPAVIESIAFPFDQGRAHDKGLEPRRLKSGALRADVDLALWEEEVNLPESEWVFLLRWLVEAGRRVGHIGQNWKFDKHHFRAGTRFWAGVELDPFTWWDTQLANRHLDPTEATGLKPTAARLWGADETAEADEVAQALIDCKKLYGLKKPDDLRYDLLPWDIIGPYAAQDTVLTLRLAEYQWQRIEDGEGSLADMYQQLDLSRVLYRMERRGLGPFDKDRASRIALFLSLKAEEAAARLPFSPATPSRGRAYFFTQLGQAPWKGGEKPHIMAGERVKQHGTLTTSVCRRMAAAGVPGAADYGRVLRLETANRMHYQGYVDLCGEDGQIRTSFRQGFVVSDRMSVERFQAQALPKHLGMTVDGRVIPEPRTLFGVRPGYVRLNFDLAQAELRIAAKLANCVRMIEILESGGDLHGDACRNVFGITPQHPDWTAKRDIAKRGVFGFVFGIGPRTFRNDLWKHAELDIPMSEAVKVIDGLRATYPEYQVAFSEWEDFARHYGCVPLYNGHLAWLQPYEYPDKGWNRRVQASLAHFVADWLIQIELMTQQWEALTLSVHDSAVVEVPESEAPAVTAAIVDWTARAWREAFGISGGCDVGTFVK